MSERTQKSSQLSVKIQVVHPAAKALSAAAVRKELRAAVAKLSDTDLKFARAATISILMLA